MFGSSECVVGLEQPQVNVTFQLSVQSAGKQVGSDIDVFAHRLENQVASRTPCALQPEQLA